MATPKMNPDNQPVLWIHLKNGWTASLNIRGPNRTSLLAWPSKYDGSGVPPAELVIGENEASDDEIVEWLKLIAAEPAQ